MISKLDKIFIITMSRHREIPKNPLAPNLNLAAITALTELCFRSDNAFDLTLDTIFVFGTSIGLDQAAEAILALTGDIKHSQLKKIVFTGGYPSYEDSRQISQPESKLLYEKLKDKLLPHLEICFESTSENCKENIINSLSYLQESHAIALVAKNFALGRFSLTFKKYLPNKQLFLQPFAVLYPETGVYITKDNWYKHEAYRKKVWGEFLRIKAYGECGELAFDEIKESIAKIEQYCLV